MMKFDFLEKLEEKFVFKTSHFFFHFLVGLALLTLVGSVLLFLWGITPSFKPGVDKAEYPVMSHVSTDEIAKLVIPPPKIEKKKVTEKAITTSTEQKEVVVQIEEKTKLVDLSKIAYEQAIDSLKSLIPPKKYLWSNKGHYERGSYKKGRRWEYGKHWVVDIYGLKAKLALAYKTANASEYTDKTAIVFSYIPILIQFEEKHRYGLIKSLMLYTKESVGTTQSNMQLLVGAIQNFGTAKTDFIQKLALFGKKNPRDGAAFIKYANQIIPKFEKDYREKVLDGLITSYYNYYNNIERQIEATDSFLPMLKKFEGQYQQKALTTFYSLHINKNSERTRQIEYIEDQYVRDMREAEFILQNKKAEKAVYLYQGLIGIGGSIVFIAVIALILVLLSIQRNIKQLKIEYQK